MRRSALVVALVAFAAMLATLMPAVAAPTVVQPAGIAYAGEQTGRIFITPDEFFEGEKVDITANFGSDKEGQGVAFLKKVSSDPDDYEEFDSDDANSYGNAYLRDHGFDAEEEIFARTDDGDVTQLLVVDPKVVVPGACTESGSLYVDPALITEGQKVKLTANFASDQAGADVTFFSKIGEVETVIDTDDANNSGNAYLYDYEVEEAQDIYALSSKGKCTPPKSVAPTEIDPDNFPESGSISTNPSKVFDGRKATVVANFSNSQAGANVTLFKLKKKNGGYEAVGEDEANSSGNANITFEFDGSDTLFGLSDNGVRTPVREFTPAAPSDISGGPKTLGNRVIYVTTNSGKTPVTKGVDYEGKAVLSEGDEDSETFDLETIAVRGNSSADKAKKPYKIKFDKNQEPFGLAKEKTFVLLANYGDWTLIRSMVAWDLGMMLDGLKWTPDSVFTEVFLNGKYKGSYQMVESIKIDENRANVDPETGQIIEFDPHYREDGVPGMRGQTGVSYAWKDPDEFKTLDEEDGGGEDPEGLTAAKIDAMKQKIRNFEDVLYGPEGNRNWATYDPSPATDWMTYLDLDSAVDYYLAREFTKDNDADMYRSNFFYTNDVDPESADQFFMGPIWDFDRSAGAKPAGGSTSVTEPEGWWMRGNGSQNHDTNKIHWYTRITDDPRFLDALDDRWDETKQHFRLVARAGPAGEESGVSAAVIKLGGTDSYDLGKQVAENDRDVWQSFGSRYAPKTSSYGGEISWVKNWYEERYDWMDGQLGN